MTAFLKRLSRVKLLLTIKYFRLLRFQGQPRRRVRNFKKFFCAETVDLYKNIKILLIVDESSITEARADKLSRLIRNLLKSFKSLKSIQDEVILVINKAKPESQI